MIIPNELASAWNDPTWKRMRHVDPNFPTASKNTHLLTLHCEHILTIHAASALGFVTTRLVIVEEYEFGHAFKNSSDINAEFHAHLPDRND